MVIVKLKPFGSVAFSIRILWFSRLSNNYSHSFYYSDHFYQLGIEIVFWHSNPVG